MAQCINRITTNGIIAAAYIDAWLVIGRKTKDSAWHRIVQCINSTVLVARCSTSTKCKRHLPRWSVRTSLRVKPAMGNIDIIAKVDRKHFTSVVTLLHSQY